MDYNTKQVKNQASQNLPSAVEIYSGAIYFKDLLASFKNLPNQEHAIQLATKLREQLVEQNNGRNGLLLGIAEYIAVTRPKHFDFTEYKPLSSFTTSGIDEFCEEMLEFKHSFPKVTQSELESAGECKSQKNLSFDSICFLEIYHCRVLAEMSAIQLKNYLQNHPKRDGIENVMFAHDFLQDFVVPKLCKAIEDSSPVKAHEGFKFLKAVEAYLEYYCSRYEAEQVTKVYEILQDIMLPKLHTVVTHDSAAV